MRRLLNLVLTLALACVGFVAGAPLASAAGDGTVFAFGDAPHHGSTGSASLTQPLVGFAALADGSGYWELGRDGGVFSFGRAGFFGSTGDIRLTSPVVGMAATRSGNGYWMVAGDGGIFAFGDAQFFGSMGGTRLARPVVAMAPTPTGRGYWLVAADGGMFSFGDAQFFGSMGGQRLGMPIVGMAATSDGGGYWLVGEDGAVYAFGNAAHMGNAPGHQRVAGIAATSLGDGYWIVDRTGSVFAFGSAPFQGSTDPLPEGRVAVAIASTSSGQGYWVLAGEAVGPVLPSSSTARLQARLDALGYWNGPANGSFSVLTTQALYALQKSAGIPRSGNFDAATSRALDTGVLPTPRSQEGYLVEIDKARQVLMFVSNGRIVRVFNTSTGNNKPYTSGGKRAVAVTPEGSFQIYTQINGLRISDLGELFRPKYFTGGYAIHGSPSIPPYPASHGCVRVSNGAINFIWDSGTLPLGTPVLVYS